MRHYTAVTVTLNDDPDRVVRVDGLDDRIEILTSMGYTAGLVLHTPKSNVNAHGKAVQVDISLTSC